MKKTSNAEHSSFRRESVILVIAMITVPTYRIVFKLRFILAKLF